MAFWSSPTLDPKRQYKFKISFPTLGSDAQFLAQSADRPTYTISDTTKVDFLDKSFNFPGKITWNPIKIKFVDAIASQINVSSAVYNYLARAGWINPQDVGGSTPNFRTIGKSSSVANTGDVEIHVLDSNGVAIDKWNLKNAFITTATLNNLDYAAEGILTAEFTFRYDWADFSGTGV